MKMTKYFFMIFIVLIMEKHLQEDLETLVPGIT